MRLCSRWSSALVAAGALATTPAGAADDPAPTAYLRAALDALPVATPDSFDPFAVVFVDRAAAERAAIGAPPSLAERLPRSPPWRRPRRTRSDASGGPVDETSSFMGFGSAPESVTAWGGLSAGTVAALRDRLPALGFEPLPGVPDGFANGPAMGVSRIDRAPGDPWRGMMGATDAIAVAGHQVSQMKAPELLLSTIGGQAAAGSGATAAFGAALAGLDAAAAEAEIGQARRVRLERRAAG